MRKSLFTFVVLLTAASMVLAGCATKDSAPGGTTEPPKGGGEGKNTPPQALVTYGPLGAVAGQEVSFDATGSQGGGQVIAAVKWSFGDGTTGEGLTTKHAYAEPGDYVVTATVTNAAGLSAINSQSLLYVRIAPKLLTADSTLDNTPPRAAISADAQVVQPGTLVTFSGGASHAWVANAKYDPDNAPAGSNFPISPSAAGIQEYAWDFGDGATMTVNKTAPSVNHTYAAPGLYAVKLTVKDAENRTGMAGYTVFVQADVAPPVSAPNKDVFVSATISGPKSVDPAYAYDSSSGVLIQNVGETLFGYERDNLNQVIPVLAAEVPTAENGGVSADGKEYTIKIRQGVKFHDGTTLDAAAVKFSLDRVILMNDPNSCAVTVLQDIILGAKEYIASKGTQADRDAYLAKNGVEVKDTHTLVLRLPEANAATFQRLAYHCSAILSPTAYKAPHAERTKLWGVASTADGLPPVGKTRDPWADLNIVGTGPFTIRAWLPGDRVIFDRFDGYWDTAHMPKIKTAIVRYVDDLNTRVLMLKSGQADDIYVNVRDFGNVEKQIKDIANIVPSQTLIIRQAAFTFHMDNSGQNKCPTDAVTGAEDCDFFADKHMRAAFSYAFDYDGFVDNVLKGLGFRSQGAIPRGMPGYNPDFKGITMDLDKAKTHLAASKHPNGFSTECWYNTGNTARQAACELIKKQMESLHTGIRVEVRNVDFNVLTDLEQKHQVPLAMIGWAPDYIATDDYIVPYYHSAGYFPASFLYKNESIDKKIDAAVKETDPVKQTQMWKEINEEVVMNDMPYIFLSQDAQVHVERNWVRGYYYNPIHSGSPNTGYFRDVSKA